MKTLAVSIILLFSVLLSASPATITFQARIVKPDLTNLESNNVSFKFYYLYPKPAVGSDTQCVIYIEEIANVNLTGSRGLVTLQLGTGTRAYGSGNLKNVFDNSTASYSCQSGGTYSPSANDNRRVIVQFDDGNGVQTLPPSELTAVPFAMHSYNSQRLGNSLAIDFLKFTDFTGTCAAGEYLKYDSTASPKFSCAIPTGTGAGIVMSVAPGTGPLLVGGTATNPTISIPQANGTTDGYLSSADFTTFNSKLSNFSSLVSSDITSKLGYTPANVATAVISVAGRTGVVTLSSSDITGLSFGTIAGTYAQGNDSRFADQRNPINDSVTSAKILDGAISSADISSGAVTFDKLNQSSATTGQVIKWNGSAWVASSDSTSGGTVTTVTASGPLASSGGASPNISLAKANGTADGYLSSSDWTTFSAKLSDFSSLLSSDITGKLGYTPVNPATAVISVAGRTGVVTLSSSDITGLSFGTITGTYAQGNDSRFTDQRVPTNDSVTSAKILNGTITSADISDASVEASKLAQMGASIGQVMKWNGSAWVASSDNTSGSGTVTTVTASGPLASSGGASPNITLAKANGTADGYLSSSDWTTFSAKLSDFSSLLSSDITGKLGYTPVNPATAVISVAGRTGVVTLSSGDISGLAFGSTAGTYAQGNDSRFTDQRTPSNDSVTSVKILDGTIASADISAGAVTFDKLNQSSATTGQVIKWNGSAWVASSDTTNVGTVTSVTAAATTFNPIVVGGTSAAPTIDLAQATTSVNGYLSSADWTTFSAKLSDFSSLLSSDITGKLGYTPVNPATAVISVAGRTGVVTLSSSDITGLSFGTITGTYAQGNDSRFTDQRVPTNDSVTSAKILDGAISSADISSGAVTFDKLNQSSATTGQVIKWNGSAWVASSDTTNAGTVTSVTAAATTFNPIVIGGTSAAPTIDLAQATTSVNGYLSSADWTTFNSKQAALGYTPLNPANDLSDVSNATTARSNLGLGTAQSPIFTGLTLSGIIGNTLLRANGSGVLASATSADITGLLGFTPTNPATAVLSVVGRTGAVTLSSGDISGLAFGTTTGTYAQGNDSRFTDQRTPANDSVTSVKILDGTIASSDISAAAITFDKINQSSATTGQVIKWSGSAWVASSDTTNAGTVTSVTAAATTFNPIVIGGTSAALTIDLAKATASVNGYLSSADWTLFNSKLSNFSTLTSSDITGKLGYTPANSNSAWSLNLSGDVSRVTGNVGIGTASPAAALHVTSGQILGASNLNSTSTINFATGNLQYTASNCGAFALWNMKDGGSYSFTVKGTTSTTCSFTAYSDNGTTPLTVRLPPNHTATTASKHTLYSFLVMGTDVYVAFIPGY